MAIALEFISFIVPIQTIRQKYPGGWTQCLIDHQASIGKRVWFDEHLFRDGAISSGGVSHLKEKWQKLGFSGGFTVKGMVRWVDFCVVDNLCTQPSSTCDWLEISEDGSSCHLKHALAGAVVGRGSALNRLRSNTTSHRTKP